MGGGPERLVEGSVVGLVASGIDGNHGAAEADFDGTLEFGDARFDVVVEENHGDALEPVGVGVAELGEPIVVGAEDVPHEDGVGNGVEVQADGGV